MIVRIFYACATHDIFVLRIWSTCLCKETGEPDDLSEYGWKKVVDKDGTTEPLWILFEACKDLNLQEEMRQEMSLQ